jgi:hypothetical protein
LWPSLPQPYAPLLYASVRRQQAAPNQTENHFACDNRTMPKPFNINTNYNEQLLDRDFSTSRMSLLSGCFRIDRQVTIFLACRRVIGSVELM